MCVVFFESRPRSSDLSEDKVRPLGLIGLIPPHSEEVLREQLLGICAWFSEADGSFIDWQV